MRSKKIILDCVRERRPPFSPEHVVTEFADVLHSYGIHKIVGDNYAGEWPKEQFRKCAITYEKADKNRSEIYHDVLPLMNSGAVELLDNKRMVSQFVALERRVSIGGREQINHPAGGHDDLVNAIAGVLCMLAQHQVGAVEISSAGAAEFARLTSRRFTGFPARRSLFPITPSGFN
jgi:hypothetical protein